MFKVIVWVGAMLAPRCQFRLLSGLTFVEGGLGFHIAVRIVIQVPFDDKNLEYFLCHPHPQRLSIVSETSWFASLGVYE